MLQRKFVSKMSEGKKSLDTLISGYFIHWTIYCTFLSLSGNFSYAYLVSGSADTSYTLDKLYSLTLPLLFFFVPYYSILSFTYTHVCLLTMSTEKKFLKEIISHLLLSAVYQVLRSIS